MTVTMPERLAFRGAAVKGHLIAPVGPDDSVVSCDALLDWPTGSDGRFQAVIGRGLPNEEKVLCAIRSGAVLTIAVRGWDSTTRASHAATETIEHVHTAHDADEANDHASHVYGHGVASDDSILGARKAATLRNKTIDGGLNNLLNIPASASPEIETRLDDLEAADEQFDTDLTQEITDRTAGDAANATAIASNATAISNEATARANADTAHTADADPHSQYATLAEVDAIFPDDPANAASSDNGTFSGTTPSATQGSLTSLSVTYVVPPSGKIRVDVSAVIRVSAGGAVGKAVHVGYEVRQTNVSGAVISAASVDRAALTETTEAVGSMTSVTHVGLTPGSTVFVRLLHWVNDGSSTGAVRARRLTVVGFV